MAAYVSLAAAALRHAYGALHYGTRWRLHAVASAVAASGAIAVAARLRDASPQTKLGRGAGWSLALFVIVYVGIALGLYEGLYNHVVKNVLFFSGAPRALLLRMFPPPTYHLPDDVLFELTGVAQVVPTLSALRSAAYFIRLLARPPRGQGILPNAV